MRETCKMRARLTALSFETPMLPHALNDKSKLGERWWLELIEFNPKPSHQRSPSSTPHSSQCSPFRFDMSSTWTSNSSSSTAPIIHGLGPKMNKPILKDKRCHVIQLKDHQALVSYSTWTSSIPSASSKSCDLDHGDSEWCLISLAYHKFPKLTTTSVQQLNPSTAGKFKWLPTLLTSQHHTSRMFETKREQVCKDGGKLGILLHIAKFIHGLWKQSRNLTHLMPTNMTTTKIGQAKIKHDKVGSHKSKSMTHHSNHGSSLQWWPVTHKVVMTSHEDDQFIDWNQSWVLSTVPQVQDHHSCCCSIVPSWASKVSSLSLLYHRVSNRIMKAHLGYKQRASWNPKRQARM